MRFLIAATIATLAIGTTTVVNAQIESEIEVLKALATSTGGWENFGEGAWNVTTVSNACMGLLGGWNGIQCNQIDNQDRVIQIHFPFRKRINGTIGKIDFNKLPYLQRLYISETELINDLPNLSTHPTLKILQIWGNTKLLGPISTSNLPPQLERLSISGNYQTSPWNQGELPLFNLVNSTTLKYIEFDNAQVTGTLPSFERFINLEEFRLKGNKITGGVPRFGPSLRTLDLSYNELSAFDVANIPVTVQTVSLSQNKIVAPFPDLSKLTDPVGIYLGGNGFYGPVPINRIPAPFKGDNITEIQSWTYRLNFDRNSLTGSLPNLTTTWLQSRAAPGKSHKLVWSADCNLFESGLPSLAPIESTCYDNKAQQCSNINTCPEKLPGSTSGNTTPPPTTTSPPTKPAGPKNHATATTTATSIFTGVIATVCAALVARF